MIEIDALRSRMARQAMAIASGNGYTPSPVPRVKILYVDRHSPRQPVMYEPGIVIVFQGTRSAIAAIRSSNTIRATTC